MKGFVIGASGYIGKRLFLKSSRSFDTYGTLRSISKKEGTMVPLKLDCIEEFDYSLIQRSDVVFLAAAISSPDMCSKKRDYTWSINVEATSCFISKLIEVGARVIFFSSDTVYGEKDKSFDELAFCSPIGEYAEMKYEVEKRFLENTKFKSIRLSYVFSKEDKFTNYLLNCAQRSEEAEIFHPFLRAVIHRDDVVQGLISLAKRWHEFPQKIINFGGPEVIDRIEFAQIIKKVAIPGLKFCITKPDVEFFKSRPKVICMMSPILAELLERAPRSLKEAARNEFI